MCRTTIHIILSERQQTIPFHFGDFTHASYKIVPVSVTFDDIPFLNTKVDPIPVYSP